ncbi:MAG: hypothetical protein ACOX3I_10740 [Limnochordia bacterium]
MVTLGFGQIVRILLNNMDRPINITNGPNGLVAIDPPRIFGYTFASLESQYVLDLGCCRRCPHWGVAACGVQDRESLECPAGE